MSSSKWGSLSPFPTSLPKPPNDSRVEDIGRPFQQGLADLLEKLQRKDIVDNATDGSQNGIDKP